MDIKLFKIEPIQIETDSVEYLDESFVNFQVLSAETQFPNPVPVPVPVPQPPPHIPQSYTHSSKSDATLTFYAADNDNVAPIFESAPNIQFQRNIVSAPTPTPEKNIQHNIVQKRIRKKRTKATTDDVNKKYKCDQCSKHFTTNKNLEDHLTVVHGRDKPFKCGECFKTWPTRGKLNEHLISHTTATPHICHICSAEFKRIAGLKQHKLDKHSIVTIKVTPAKLDSRQKKKRKISALEELKSDLTPPLSQLEVEDGAAPIITPIKYDWTNKCKVCFLTCNSGYTLQHHMKIVHSTEKEKRFQCDIKTCLKKFPTLRKLQIHSCFVHGQKCDAIKIYKCEFCPSQYECKAHLELHIVDKHVEDKDFKCSVCSKTFIDQMSLTKHTRANHNTKKELFRNVCDVCATRFKDVKPLVQHLASVHKRLHYCRKCKHSFDLESDFDQHLDFQVSKTLNLEIQFKCQLCSVTFNSQCNLNTHNTGHTRVLEVKQRNFNAGKRKL